MRLERGGRVVLLYGRSTCCVNLIPGGGKIRSIGGNIQSPRWSGLRASEVCNIVLDVPGNISSTARRAGVVSTHSGGVMRGRSGAARVGVNILIHLELSSGKANVLAMVSK